jgi:hypothetical protein
MLIPSSQHRTELNHNNQQNTQMSCLSRDALTLLRGTVLCGDSLVASVGRVGTSIELLITAPLQRSSKLHKRVALDRERTLGVSRVENGRRCNAAERTGEGLRVGLAGNESASASDEEEDGGELHFGEFGFDWLEFV